MPNYSNRIVGVGRQWKELVSGEVGSKGLKGGTVSLLMEYFVSSFNESELRITVPLNIFLPHYQVLTQYFKLATETVN